MRENLMECIRMLQNGYCPEHFDTMDEHFVRLVGWIRETCMARDYLSDFLFCWDTDVSELDVEDIRTSLAILMVGEETQPGAFVNSVRDGFLMHLLMRYVELTEDKE